LTKQRHANLKYRAKRLKNAIKRHRTWYNRVKIFFPQKNVHCRCLKHRSKFQITGPVLTQQNFKGESPESKPGPTYCVLFFANADTFLAFF